MMKKTRGFVPLLLMFGFAAVSFSCSSPTGSIGSLRTNQTPVSGDYTVGNVYQTAGNVTAVTITAKSGKSPGAVTIFYNGSTTLPTAAGTYPVTFNVAAAAGWNAATGLSAGSLNIANPTPVAGDFDVVNLNQTAGNVTAVIITAKSGKSPGAVTIFYNGSTTLPTAAGTYPVTFNVAAAAGWSAATGLSAGDLVVTSSSGIRTPAAGDYIFGNLNQTAGSVTAVTITPRSGQSLGARTVYYQGTGGTTYNRNTDPPQADGTYLVTFNVAAVSGWNAVNGLSAGTLVVIPANSGGNQTPVEGDYTFGNLNQTAGSVTAVTITPRSGKSPGAITGISYRGLDGTIYNSSTPPQAAGTYAVTFNVAAAAAAGWNNATGLSAGILIVVNQTPVASDYIFGNMYQMEECIPAVIPPGIPQPGNPPRVTAVTVTPKNGKSPGERKNIRYSGNTTIPQEAGMYAVTFNVDAATNWNAAEGLSAGNLIVTSPFTVTETTPSTVTISAYNGTSKNVAIPKQMKDGKNITAIGNLAFNNKQLTYITIPDSVTTIENGAFADNSLTVGIAIPNSVTFIGSEAFYNNKLTGITISDKVTAILPRAFSHNQLAGVTIPDNVTNIGVHAFSYNQLKSVTIPANVTTIEMYAFSYNQLAGVAIPSKVTTIERYAFSYNQLTGVSIPNSVTTIEEGAFRSNRLDSIIIPDSVTTIGIDAFSGNPLRSVTIGANVTIANSDAFPPGFYSRYNSSSKQKGTYTRPDTNSTTWTKQQ